MEMMVRKGLKLHRIAVQCVMIVVKSQGEAELWFGKESAGLCHVILVLVGVDADRQSAVMKEGVVQGHALFRRLLWD